jgi:elongation factor P--(R)-beta-lysine ligase
VTGRVRLEALALRGRLLAQVREFFAARGVLEVETPAIYPHAPPDPHQQCLAVHDGAGRRIGFLQPSPEFAMKRLLAAGAPSIYQVARAFRAGESGARHRVEFTLVEWYRPGWDYRALMDETVALVQVLTGCAPTRRASWRELVREVLGADPLDAPDPLLWGALAARGIKVTPALRTAGRASALELLFALRVEPERIGTEAVLVCDYPAWQTAQARRCAHDDRLAERFELYAGGLELANGYTELTDADELRARFEADNAARCAAGLPVVDLDPALLHATAALPPCAGVAVGLDRVAMLAAGVVDIADVLALDIQNS